MAPSNHPHDELLTLADAQCNGADDDATTARLEELMVGDPAARRVYSRYLFLHAQLATADGSLSSVPLKRARPASRRARWRRWALPACLAVAAGVSALAVWIAPGPPGNSPPDDAAPIASAPPGDAAPPVVHYSVDVEDTDNSVLAELGAHDDAEWVGQASQAESGELRRGTLRLKRGRAEIDFMKGPRVELEGDSVLSISSGQTAALLTGTLSAKPERPTDTPFIVETPGLRLVEQGTEYRIAVLENNATEVHVLEGAVELFRRTRLPRFYWRFDDPTASAGGDDSPIVVGPGARRVGGIVGSGAYEFDNSGSAYLDVGNGGGDEIGSGAFSVTTGVTVEAMIVSRWSGRPPTDGVFDYDEIFRKEDGSYRILLCFQHDQGKKGRYDIPDVADGPCLSFGLHLAGLGYSELDMPLDGKSGRPTLADLTDGRAHHVAATYDAATGAKSIWIDGVLRFRHEFPRGSLIVSGGARPAAIGNFSGDAHVEPFTGVIDEVAFYDFALTSQEIADHARRAAAGQPYFDLPGAANSFGAPYKLITLLKPGRVLRFDARGEIY